METAGAGFYTVQENSSKWTLSKRKVVEILNNDQYHMKTFPEICTLRSYYIEKMAVNRRKRIDLPSAMAGGAATGFFGLAGVPFNLAYTFFMYFRSVQAIALFYGYDVVDDPRELEFASSVTMTCLSPHLEADVNNLGTVISKMMLAANVSSLKKSLSNLSYKQMAQKGGAELLYVQIRALAHASAKKRSMKREKTGWKRAYLRIFSNNWERCHGDRQEAVPIIGAVIGAFPDTYR